ncbi:dual specificity protein kinase pom1 [Verticillium alfalfae VaMs.102]|uniref:dual-specificity kinase n=1 Tax=Verticillium alfalfae (strain VaMs.102 / ATCC MYA-4576 / FGSC 10136) TaxID=526221 RepID=C9S578_VERA1|nr:dual specificity protein kinase pom1 [Verticillium alfalfae VaMs.102]EEY14178.1 dual specificity protein kinase pom1 [Verticillium alfalfae VaMs.102]
MVKEYRPPAGPRPASFSPTKHIRDLSNPNGPQPSFQEPRVDAPMLSTSTTNGHPLFAFGGGNGPSVQDGGDTTGAYDFLPSVSFDDLQSSLESASTDFKLTQFPSPTGQGSILESGTMTEKPPTALPSASTPRAAGNAPPVSRPGRSGSILRRPSTSTRQTSISSTMSASSGGVGGGGGVLDAPTAPAAMRNRRQSHYPPVSNSNIAKPPRKSIGPGILDGDYASRPGQKRRPSLISNAGSSADSTRTSIDGTMNSGFDTTRSFTNVRTAKARSIGPPLPRTNSASLTAGNIMTPEQNRLSAAFSPRSPHGAGRGTMAPGSAQSAASQKRASIMPGMPHSSHATGLGARTISPTDTRRMKRLSTHQPQSLNHIADAPPPPPLEPREHSRSPSMIPRKASATPSSSRTTPDINRKSYSSGLSIAPKSLASHSHGNNAGEDAEDVPPVPAIPKARTEDGCHARRGDKKANPPVTKRNPPGMRLPPITVGPLNPSTAAKVAALQAGHSDRNLSPPPSRILAKTPSTPMTASKSSFFSRNHNDEKIDLPNLRSSSTVNHNRLDSASGVDGGSSSDSLMGMTKKTRRKPSMSPFLSSSVPKNDPDAAFIKRPKTGDIGNLTEPIPEASPQRKPSGPRPQKPVKAKPKSPVPNSDPEEPPTPSSMSSLRRKLSLSWKRSASKNGTAQPAATTAKPTEPSVRQDSMPPPRIPISATVGNLGSIANPSSPHVGTPKSTGTYLESRRRKSSASSLQTFGHDRTKSDNWAPNGTSTPRKEMPGDTPKERTQPMPRNASVMQKILRPKASAATMRANDPWTADLDKDDLIAEEEIRKMGSRRKETEIAARTLDALKKRATPKERVGPHEAIRIAMLNLYERGEIIDYSDVYFCGTQNAQKVVGDLQSDKPNFGYDDERGDYTIVPGDHLAFRYEIIDILGKGSFGQVVRCIDHKTGVLVAVKIIRNKKRFHQQALVEVNILQKLREWDPKNKHSMVKFTHSFYFRGHLCISTELLDMNLYEFIKVNAFRGFSLKMIRRFTKQMLSSLVMLKQHKVIHCDLKPENILLRHPLHTELKVIDFGSSCFENEKVYTYIQSRFYRSPEVILGMTYGMPIDMWSVGCILAELYTGVPIFPGENEQEQLACIMEVFGPPEKHLIEKSTRKKLFFDSMGKPRLTVSSKGRRRRPSSKTLQQAIKCDDEPFLDFLTRCLRWDPDRRLKPEDAIYHEFITGRKATAPAPRIPARDASPAKRHNTASAPRPLPEPPGLGIKGGPTLRAREATGVSPHKPVSGPVRRTSGATGAVHVAAIKRTSTGTGSISTGASNLPRAAGRSVSAKQDLASAGAAAAMTRR